jgi:acetamidase/formamidase
MRVYFRMTGSLVLLCLLSIVSACTQVAVRATEKTVELKASAKTVHQNFFDASLKPVLTIDSGDIVRLETATGNPKYFEKHGVPKDKIPQELYAAFDGLPYDDSGPDRGRADSTLNGPIKVNGAEPGDVLEVRIRSVQVRFPIAALSFVPDRGLLTEDFPYEKHRVLFLDLDKQTAEFAPGIVVPLKPFWGTIGVAPPAKMGRVSSGPPNIFGGNFDNKDLVAGTTVYLPVYVAGGLLSLGDGHAAEGAGEVCLSAIEVSLKGEIQVILHKGKSLKLPRAETPTHYMTMGFDRDLDVAAKIATREMLDWMVEMKGLTRDDAYLIASVAMDLNVTQVVDGTKGIHAMLPKSMFK